MRGSTLRGLGIALMILAGGIAQAASWETDYAKERL